MAILANAAWVSGRFIQLCSRRLTCRPQCLSCVRVVRGGVVYCAAPTVARWCACVLAPDCGCAVSTVCWAKVTRLKCVAWETCDLGLFGLKRLMRNFAACMNSNTPPRSRLQNHVALCCMTCSPSAQTSVPLPHTCTTLRILNRLSATSRSARHDAPDAREQRIIWTAAHAV